MSLPSTLSKGVIRNVKTKSIIPGAMSGIVGGMVFGMMMGMMGMLPMVAKLVGSHSAMVGLVVHLMNSALIGAAFGLLFGGKTDTLLRGSAWGSAYGVIWWFAGALVIMPIWLGMPAQISMSGMKSAMPSLMGHVIYGVITAIVFNRLAKRSAGHAVAPSLSR